MSSLRKALRGRGAELVIEAALIVFAVLVAMAVDEWSEGQELSRRAARAQDAILAEMRNNRADLLEARTSLDSLQIGLAADLQRLTEGESVNNSTLAAYLPEFTDAAWITAQTTGAVANMEYEWVLAAARVYSTQEASRDVMNGFLDAMAAAIGQGPSVERFADLSGRLFLLREFYNGLETAYQELLVEVSEGG